MVGVAVSGSEIVRSSGGGVDPDGEGASHQSIGDVWLRMRGQVDSRPADVVPVHPREVNVVDPAHTLPEDVHSPISHAVLSHVHGEMKTEGLTLDSIHQGAHKRFATFCRPDPGLDGKVVYPTMCGSMCRECTQTPGSVTDMRDDFSACITRLVKSIGGPRVLLTSELMVVVFPGPRFFTIAAALCQSGNNPAAEVFVESTLEGVPAVLEAWGDETYLSPW